MKPSLDPYRIREEFPILRQKVRGGKPLVYLDNAATSQKPQVVIDSLMRFYAEDNASVHRGVHALSERATRAYEEARRSVQRFVNAAESREIIFVRGCTEAINLVAQTFGRQSLTEGDEIILSEMEHHSNILPWQMICEEKGARIRVIPINGRGELDMEAYARMLHGRVKLVSITHVSNVLGTINPVREMIAEAHRHGVPALVDGAQAVPHMPVDVQELDCDFYAFSGHKMFGPTGIGALYGKAALLDAMPPYQGGGSMISLVTFERSTYAPIPQKFEAGTPNAADAIGLHATIDYLENIGMEAIAEYEHELLEYATHALETVQGVRLIGTAREKASVISFEMEGVHPHDIGTILDQEGVAVRVGHHCCQPLMNRLGVPATVRASFAIYNTREEVDRLVDSLARVREVFG
jgi:cysteine desulfurase/selenocysteine lyase